MIITPNFRIANFDANDIVKGARFRYCDGRTRAEFPKVGSSYERVIMKVGQTMTIIDVSPDESLSHMRDKHVVTFMVDGETQPATMARSVLMGDSSSGVMFEMLRIVSSRPETMLDRAFRAYLTPETFLGYVVLHNRQKLAYVRTGPGGSIVRAIATYIAIINAQWAAAHTFEMCKLDKIEPAEVGCYVAATVTHISNIGIISQITFHVGSTQGPWPQDAPIYEMGCEIPIATPVIDKSDTHCRPRPESPDPDDQESKKRIFAHTHSNTLPTTYELAQLYDLACQWRHASITSTTEAITHLQKYVDSLETIMRARRMRPPTKTPDRRAVRFSVYKRSGKWVASGTALLRQNDYYFDDDIDDGRKRLLRDLDETNDQLCEGALSSGQYLVVVDDILINRAYFPSDPNPTPGSPNANI